MVTPSVFEDRDGLLVGSQCILPSTALLEGVSDSLPLAGQEYGFAERQSALCRARRLELLARAFEVAAPAQLPRALHGDAPLRVDGGSATCPRGAGTMWFLPGRVCRGTGYRVMSSR